MASPANKAKIISVEILPNINFGTEIRSQSNLKVVDTSEINNQTAVMSDTCSVSSDMKHLFNDDFDTYSLTSGTGIEIAFLSPSSVKSWMDTSENDHTKGSKNNAFDFDSDTDGFPTGSLF